MSLTDRLKAFEQGTNGAPQKAAGSKGSTLPSNAHASNGQTGRIWGAQTVSAAEIIKRVSHHLSSHLLFALFPGLTEACLVSRLRPTIQH